MKTSRPGRCIHSPMYSDDSSSDDSYVPSTFPLHQWAKTYMGMPPRNGRVHVESESYGVINVDKIVSWEPIVQIGLRTWKPTSMLCRCQSRGALRVVHARGRGRGRGNRKVLARHCLLITCMCGLVTRQRLDVITYRTVSRMDYGYPIAIERAPLRLRHTSFFVRFVRYRFGSVPVRLGSLLR